MRNSLRGRFLAATTLIALTGFLLFDVVLYRTVRAYLSEQVVRELRSGTQLTQALLEQTTWRGAESLQELWDFTYRLRQITRARVTLITADGQVLTDSDVGPEGVAHMENHLGRPEVQQAARESLGYRLGPSSTLGRTLYYSAVRIDNQAFPARFVRLAYYAEHVDATLRDVLLLLIAGSCLGLVVAALLAFVLSSAVTRPVREVLAACRQVAAGERSVRFPVQRQDELGQLAMVLQELTSQLHERALAAEEAQTRVVDLLDHLTCGALLVDEHRRVLHANRTVFQLLQMEEVLAPGRNLVEVVRSADLVSAVERALASGAAVGGELSVYSGEDRRWLSYAVRPLAAGATGRRGVLVQLSDVTEIKRLEAIRRDFVANASHELKTPLTAIVGYTETLLAQWETLPAEQRMRYLRRIREQAQRLEFLSSDLLTLAESEEKASLNLVPYPMHELLQSTAEEFADKAAEKGLTLRVIANRRLRGLMDPDAMHIVLANLVDNAIKYTGTGGRVTLRAHSTPSREVVVEVADTGVGIDPRHHQRIFERFYRVEKARSRAMGGTGLGLAIVKHILEKHGSSIHVESALGKGSRFWFTLAAA